MKILKTLLFLMLINCSITEIEEYPTIIPIAKGNTWKYVHYARNYSNNDQMEPIDTTYTKIIDVISLNVDSTTYDHVAVSGYFDTEDHPLIPWYNYHSNEIDGYYYLGSESFLEEKVITLFKEMEVMYPANIGDSWFMRGSYFDWNTGEVVFVSDSAEFKCVSKGTYLDTPAGRYKCIVYKRRSNWDVYIQWNFYSYYKPGLGFVGQVVIDDNGYLKEKILLMEYTIN